MPESPAMTAPGTPPPPACPDGPALLQLEGQSRRRGSGLSASELQGSWLLDQLWSRSGARPMAGAAGLLRSLGACLAITPDQAGGLQLRNSVQLGPLQLRFLGPGELRGRRPLLVFRFERWELAWGERLLRAGRLAAPAPQRLPFFALIAARISGEGNSWLAARGRGGGLALWRR